MNDQEEKMNREIEAVQWMVENQNYYIVKESAKQDFQELVKYGSNIHTYTAEALSAYHRIQEKFLNNPYLYGTTYNWQPQKEKKDYAVYSHTICGYFITVSNEEKQLSVPFGVYRQWVSKQQYETQVRQFLEKRKRELIQYEKKVTQKIEIEISQLESQIITLTQEAFSIDKRPNLKSLEQIWKEQGTQDLLIWVVSLVVILLFWARLIQIGQGEQEFIKACIPFGLVMLWRQWRKILVKRTKRRLQKEKQILSDYIAQYKQNCTVCKKKLDDMRIYELEASNGITTVDMQVAENRLYQYLHQKKEPLEEIAWGKKRYRLFVFMTVCTVGYALYVWYQYFSTYVPS